MLKTGSCAQARSLLTAHEDFTTLQFHAGQPIQRPGFVFTTLKRHLSEENVEQIKRMSLTADGQSAIFDVPSELVQVTDAHPWWNPALIACLQCTEFAWPGRNALLFVKLVEPMHCRRGWCMRFNVGK